MSGGHFDYQQFRINDIIDGIQRAIEINSGEYSDETLSAFKDAIGFLTLGRIYAHRIDWLLSGDDGEESFHRRLKEDLTEMEE